MNNKNPDIANEQALLINFIKDSERTQEDTLKIFQEKVENIVSRGIDSGESANDEKEALSKAIEALYREASVRKNGRSYYDRKRAHKDMARKNHSRCSESYGVDGSKRQCISH